MNGDIVVVRELGQSVLVAVVDALGHGPKAADIALASAEYLQTARQGIGMAALVQGLHRALQGTRGVASLLFLISAAGLEACSVGNVDLRSSNVKLPFVLTPGVLGVRLRLPKVCRYPSPIADRFVLFSDGISGRFDLRAGAADPPDVLASRIFASHRHAHDDATVVVMDVNTSAS